MSAREKGTAREKGRPSALASRREEKGAAREKGRPSAMHAAHLSACVQRTIFQRHENVFVVEHFCWLTFLWCLMNAGYVFLQLRNRARGVLAGGQARRLRGKFRRYQSLFSIFKGSFAEKKGKAEG